MIFLHGVLLLLIAFAGFHNSSGATTTPPETTTPTSRECKAYASDGRECSIPFIYKGVTYHQCTDVDNPQGRSWCSLTPNFDIDQRWARCAGVICKVFSVSGQKCVFPFTYKGVTFNYCTDVDNNDNLWCSYTSNFQDQWGKCGETLCGDCTVRTEWGKTCRFPFYYKGTWEHCTMADNPRPWCSLNGHSKYRGLDWDACVASECSEKPELPPAPPLSKTANPCKAYTVTGKECSIPFIYKGVRYPKPTDVDNKGVIWCGLTPNVDRDKQWERFHAEVCPGCYAVTETHQRCQFPFEYYGRTFNYCTNADTKRLWCSYDSVHHNNWGFCTGVTVCPEKDAAYAAAAAAAAADEAIAAARGKGCSIPLLQEDIIKNAGNVTSEDDGYFVVQPEGDHIVNVEFDKHPKALNFVGVKVKDADNDYVKITADYYDETEGNYYREYKTRDHQNEAVIPVPYPACFGPVVSVKLQIYHLGPKQKTSFESAKIIILGCNESVTLTDEDKRDCNVPLISPDILSMPPEITLNKDNDGFNLVYPLNKRIVVLNFIRYPRVFKYFGVKVDNPTGNDLKISVIYFDGFGGQLYKEYSTSDSFTEANIIPVPLPDCFGPIAKVELDVYRGKDKIANPVRSYRIRMLGCI